MPEQASRLSGIPLPVLEVLCAITRHLSKHQADLPYQEYSACPGVALHEELIGERARKRLAVHRQNKQNGS